MLGSGLGVSSANVIVAGGWFQFVTALLDPAKIKFNNRSRGTGVCVSALVIIDGSEMYEYIKKMA